MTVAPEVETSQSSAPSQTLATITPEVLENTAEEDVIFPNGDLYSDEPPLESDLHLKQIMILLQCLEYLWQDRQDFYACGNLTIYYSPRQLKSELFRGPDFFVVLNTERKPRKSWAVWEENGKYPNIIIEVLSSKTAKTDRGLKKEIYQDIFRTPDYFWFDPYSLELKGFHIVEGVYQEIAPNESGWLWSHQLDLYLGVRDSKLRYFTPEGELVPTPEEAAERESQQRQEAEQRAESERQRAEQTQQQLAELESLLARYREQFGELE
ncbi:Uma2 family endonuclease [Oscillatoria sp. FACHB-1406]|uniref:Uma2 family endonuclease n=1 Tax=Oscillatoria sp. FACHB-1406 TaxID=2692846 RepID=UPI001683DFB7|nr:Uma2 family endonuclease [Oscillatoria sp. FACHB-1406]MBD2576604.1 Uma2 family endonuclease [Oscillatoria sp. FACHB-1406]